MQVHVGSLPPLGAAEIVERKGTGHPDSITDALAEALSARLCREYLERFGKVLHHNVDKALLFGGASRPALGGGQVLAPMELTLAGRATVRVGAEVIAVEELAVEVVEDWVRRHLRFVDPARHLVVHTRVRPGSVDLGRLFTEPEEARCNDTSIGVGYAPLSPLERAVLEVERRLGTPELRVRHPALGEDVKVMGTRLGEEVELTVAVAMVDRFLPDAAAYEEARRAAEAVAREVVGEQARVAVNAADQPAQGRLYLTVTGTSAEAGDDGQVGRGNRVNGLITPFRPMSLEAAAGKNPVTHVGKIYNLLASDVAARIVAELPEVRAAQLALVSRIGAPVREPAFVDLRLEMADGRPPESARQAALALIHAGLDDIPRLTGELIAGRRPIC